MKYSRYILAVIIIFLMVLTAELSGQKEIIFPEFAALAIGAWVADKQPWVVNKRMIFFLMSLSSLIGVCVVRYLAFPLISEIAVCFVFAAITLTLTRTTLLPILSACILPIYLQVTTWVYPISVTFLSLVIIYFQWYLERNRMRPKHQFKPVVFNLKEEAEKWSKLFVLLIAIAFLPIHNKHLFFIAPPLIVTFTELANVQSKARKNPWRVFGLLCFAALFGSALRILLNHYLHLPLAMCAAAACLLMFYAFERFHVLFPPAGAILLLPMVLEYSEVIVYPLEVAGGSFCFITAALVLFSKKSEILPSIQSNVQQKENEFSAS